MTVYRASVHAVIIFVVGWLVMSVYLIPLNACGILQKATGTVIVPPGRLVFIPPKSTLALMVTAIDTDYKVGLRCKTGDFRIVKFPSIAVTNEIVSNELYLYRNYVMSKLPIERRSANDVHVPEETLIFAHVQPILNIMCKNMTSSEALQLSTWDASSPEMTARLQQRVPKGVKIHALRVTAVPALVDVTMDSVERLSGRVAARIWKKMYDAV